LGLEDFLKDNAIQMWGGMGLEKVVIGPARGGELLCVFAFFSAEKSDLQHEGWNIPASPQTLLNTFPDLDPNLRKSFERAEDIKQWRLISHEEYPYWQKGKVCLLGDAAHPMMPDQNQGFSQAVEDAGALGYIFSKQYADIIGQDTRKGLEIYEKVRKQRATSVQAASLKARTDVRERIGWKRAEDPPEKLTNEWLCDYDLAKHVEEEFLKIQG
jgi:salicylate hydroxylase